MQAQRLTTTFTNNYKSWRTLADVGGHWRTMSLQDVVSLHRNQKNDALPTRSVISYLKRISYMQFQAYVPRRYSRGFA